MQVSPASPRLLTKSVECSAKFNSLPRNVRAATHAGLNSPCAALANASLTIPLLKTAAVAA